jgi:hypothetical protein
MVLYKHPLAHWSRHLLICWVLLRAVHADKATHIANDSGVKIGVTVKREELRAVPGAVGNGALGIPPATSWQVVPCLDNVEVALGGGSGAYIAAWHDPIVE